MKHNKWIKGFLKNWDDMLIDDNIPWTEEDKQVLIDDISSLLKEQREKLIEEVEKLGTLLVARTKEGPELINKEKVLSILKGKKK